MVLQWGEAAGLSVHFVVYQLFVNVLTRKNTSEYRFILTLFAGAEQSGAVGFSLFFFRKNRCRLPSVFEQPLVKMMKAQVILYVLIWTVAHTAASAQAGRNFRFTHLTNDNGLPANTVYSICQDFKGFIWIATADGLCKYDGRRVTVYEVEPEKSIRKKGGIVRQVFEDRQRRLWVITQKGVNRYCRDHDRFDFVAVDSSSNFSRVLYQDSVGTIYLGGSGVFVYNEHTGGFEAFRAGGNEAVKAYVTAVTSDEKGRVWLGRMYGGLICADVRNGKLSRYRQHARHGNSLLSDKITSLFTDRRGKIWIGTEDKGVCRFDPLTNRFVRPAGFPPVCVRAFAEDAEGNIWIGSENGLYIYSASEERFVHYRQDYNDKYSLNDNAVYTIFRDREDNMLVGTYFGGINLFLNSFRQFLYYDYGYSDRSLSGKAVRQMIGDPDGNLWIATEDGGLNHYDRTTGLFDHLTHRPGRSSLSYHNVHSLLLDRQNQLWIGTYLGGLNRYDLKTRQFTHYTFPHNPELLSNNIFCLLQDRNGEIWIGTTNGVAVYNPGERTFRQFEKRLVGSNSINHLLEDSGGDIWIATRTHGVFRYDRSAQSLQNYTYRPDGTGISDNFVTYLFEDSRRILWMGTLGGGLCRFDPSDETFTVYTVGDGLPSNTVYAVTESRSGHLWLSTNNGLSCLDAERRFFVNYSISEGLPNKQFNYNSVYRAADGFLYFGTINGLIGFDPEALKMHRQTAQVEFTDFKIYGKSALPAANGSPLSRNIEEVHEIRLNSEQAKSFSFEFTVPTVSHSNTTSFAYKLSPDNDWNYIGNQNQLTYANLPAGEYTLHVKAAFTNNWNEQAPVRSIRISIAPPFWRSYTAYWLYFAAAVLAGMLGYVFMKRRRLEKLAVSAERLEKAKMAEINALKIGFFTTISHELRTPLSLIWVSLQSLLEKQGGSAEAKQKIKSAADHARRMSVLIDELMLFSKVETRQEKIRVKKGNLSAFLRSIAEGFQVLADEKGLEYVQEIPVTSEEVWFAPVKVEKIVYNLLSNAFKYTENGRVAVSARYEQAGVYTFLNLTVSDTGIGIASDQKDKIFENYYQVDDFVKSKKTGFGMGLALARRLVLLHKGSIGVESEPGRGSVFTVRLNVTAAAFSADEISDKNADALFLEEYKYLPAKYEAPATVAPCVPAGSAGKPYKILFVEDQEELLSAYSGLFGDTYTVIGAGNGSDGYRLARKELPDIVISDVMMPGMDGFALAHKLKSRIETCHIPLILLTAKTEEEAQWQGYANGADLYVKKPFDPALIRQQVANLIATKENQKKLFAANKMEIYDLKADDKDKKLIADIERLIIDNLDNSRFSLDFLLKAIGMGRTLLHVKLKNIVGLSTTEFINNVRLKESLKLLAAGKNVSEAAYGTGFSSPNYYSRCFKKVFGISPNEYLSATGRRNGQAATAEAPVNEAKGNPE